MPCARKELERLFMIALTILPGPTAAACDTVSLLKLNLPHNRQVWQNLNQQVNVTGKLISIQNDEVVLNT